MNAMTPEKKAEIDAMSYRDLLTLWRFSPAGTPYSLGKLVSISRRECLSFGTPRTPTQ